jgi:hypothetical protein
MYQVIGAAVFSLVVAYVLWGLWKVMHDDPTKGDDDVGMFG